MGRSVVARGISIINRTIRAVISTLTCKSTVAALIIQGLKCVIDIIDNSIEFALGYSRSTDYSKCTIIAVISTLAIGSNIL